MIDKLDRDKLPEILSEFIIKYLKHIKKNL